MSIHDFTDIHIPVDCHNPAIVRNDKLCIKCGACRRICERDMAIGRLYDMESSRDCPICIHCGQCTYVCPTESISERYEYQKVKKAILNINKIVIFTMSPSARLGLGEALGLGPGAFTEGKMAASLRALGADYVFGTGFAADLSIMEEASELIDRLVNKTRPLPQFTGSCPAWVKFAETFYPGTLSHLSTAKSPIGMQGPTIKTYFAWRRGINPEQIVNVAVTPCTAKKFEIRRKEMNAASRELNIPEMRDMDYVITARELAKWLKEEGIDFAGLKDSSYDSLMGGKTGAEPVCGNAGSVLEAAASTAFNLMTGKNPGEDFLKLHHVPGREGIKSAEADLNGTHIRLALVQGMDNAKQVLEELISGKCEYDYIEVLACRGGCSEARGMSFRFSHENPGIKEVYKEFYQKPLSPRAEDLLHSSYHSRYDDLGPRGIVEKKQYELEG